MPYLQRGPLKSVMSLQYFFSAFISFNIGSEIRYIQLLLSTEMEKYPIIWLLRLHFYAVPFMCLIFFIASEPRGFEISLWPRAQITWAYRWRYTRGDVLIQDRILSLISERGCVHATGGGRHTGQISAKITCELPGFWRDILLSNVTYSYKASFL